MAIKIPKVDINAPIIILDIGNSSVNIATWHGNNVVAPITIPNSDFEKFDSVIKELIENGPEGKPVAVVASSVNKNAFQHANNLILELLDKDIVLIGDRIPVGIEYDAQNAPTTGLDRLCAAAAVYEKLETSFIIIDFGSAVTVDLVSDDGEFLGGAILPGLKMQFRALHEFTSDLPHLEPEPFDYYYGSNTKQAINIGVCQGVAHAVRGLVESYASHLNRWPQVLATGGDVEFISPYCDYIDQMVSHLVLRGVGVSYSKYIQQMGLNQN